MLIAGIGIPVMAALNSGLGVRLGNPVLAATFLFALALLITVLVLLSQSRPVALHLATVPPHFFAGGIFVAFYVLAVTWIAPKIGVGNAIVLVLLGQLMASAVIDHFGWLGSPQSSLSPIRSVGISLMVLGVFLARRPIDIT